MHLEIAANIFALREATSTSCSPRRTFLSNDVSQSGHHLTTAATLLQTMALWRLRPSGLNSFCHVTEVKLGRVRTNKELSDNVDSGAV